MPQLYKTMRSVLSKMDAQIEINLEDAVDLAEEALGEDCKFFMREALREKLRRKMKHMLENDEIQPKLHEN